MGILGGLGGMCGQDKEGGMFDDIIDLIIILIVLEFLCSVISGEKDCC